MQRNFSANEWGPHFWKTMHYVAHSYPDAPTQKQKKEYERFYKSLMVVLPCSLCRKSYISYYKSLPIKLFMRDRLHLTYWVFIIHQRVNKKLKKCCLLKFKNACKIYEKNRSSSEIVHRCNADDIKVMHKKLSTEFLK